MVFDQLRGRRLSLAVGLVGAMGFMLQGYDQAVANGLLTLDSFVKTFPAIDAIHATGATKSHKSTIQGMLRVWLSYCRISSVLQVLLSQYMKSVVLLGHSRVRISVTNWVDAEPFSWLDVLLVLESSFKRPHSPWHSSS